MIRVSDKYVIEAEQLCYSASVYVDGVNPRTKEPTVTKRLIGYYSSPEKCLEEIKNYEIHKRIDGTDMDLDKAISTIKSITAEFKQYAKDNKWMAKQLLEG